VDGHRDLRALTRAIQAAGGDGTYTAYHAPRYAVALDLVRRHLPPGGGRVLDVGRSALTGLLHEHLGVPVDSLGFGPDGPTATGRHHELDLDDAQHPDRWRRDLGRYEVVVLAEVLEHLHTAPTLVLAFLSTLLAPNGVLLIQTPNALSLPKRIKPLLGIHPYEPIREDPREPGHFREYTLPELYDLARRTGFEVLHAATYNYFDLRHNRHTGATRPRWLEAAKMRLYGALPGPLRPGITLVLRWVGISEPVPVARPGRTS
jgi:SAM-dependent methyltransferase